MAELQQQLKAMEEEVVSLRRRLQDAPRRIRTLEQRLADARGQLTQAATQNEKLTYTLRDARDHIAALREEVEKLSEPPSAYGTLLRINDDSTVDVTSSGRKIRVQVHPDIDPAELAVGAEVVLNESMNVVKICEPDRNGEVVILREVLEDSTRALVLGRADEERVVELGANLAGRQLRSGTSLLLDTRSNVVLEELPRSDVEDLILEEVPNVSYDDIGGLDAQIEEIVDAVELPFLQPELFAEHQLPAPKGILLYGPPGCGKTLIAKAVAASLARKVREATGDENAKSYFLNIKGPELLNKYVGETERQIRLIFERAREKSDSGSPVIIFFDEMESLFRTRGTGISSDIENTIVPQLLAEIDGVETLKNTIIIGASNREDMIDPAILRPGRLDVKIKIERPTEATAVPIFAQYLTTDLPLHLSAVEAHETPELAVASMIEAVVECMYRRDDATRFLEVTYQTGDTEILYFCDFSSGAMIENVVRRAKKRAIKRFLDCGEKGIKTDDLLASVAQEFKEHEDLPNTTNPDDWAKISGKKGERIVFVRTLVQQDDEAGDGNPKLDEVVPGQYL